MDYIEKLNLQTDKVEEIEKLEKHIIINSEPFSVDEYEGHTKDFLAIGEDYNDGFNQLNETNGLGISCIVSKEVKEARKDVKGNFHEKLKDRIDSEVNEINSSLDNINSSLDNINSSLDNIGSIVITDYKNEVIDNDWSYALEKAFEEHYKNNTSTRIFIPKGEYRIANPIKLPSGAFTPLLQGEGSGTVLLADLQNDQFIFYNDTNDSTGGMSIKDITIKPFNNNNNGGFLNIQFTVRMFNVENVRVFDLNKGIVIGEKVWASCIFDKVGIYNLTKKENTVGIYSNGNTTNFINCEVIGFKKAIIIEDTSTSSYDRANVCYIKGGSYAGSEDVKTDTAIEIINGRDIKVEDIWIEGINDTETGAKLGKAIVIKGERSKVHFNNIHLSTSSVYVEGGVAEFNGVSFYQSSPSGFYCSEGATIIEKNTYFPYGAYFNNSDVNKIRGNIQKEITLKDKMKTNSYNILHNNILNQYRTLPFTATNISQNIDVETNDFISGINSYRITNVTYQGIQVTQSVQKNTEYTVIARVKNISNNNVYTIPFNTSSSSIEYPFRSSNSKDWEIIYGVYKSTSDTLSVKIVGEGGGSFLIDSIAIFKGYNIASPDCVELNDNLYLGLNKVEFLDVTNSPTESTASKYRLWRRGDIIYPMYPQSGRQKGWTCVESGTPGTWIGHGTL